MINLVRSGPKNLIIESSNTQDSVNYLINNFFVLREGIYSDSLFNSISKESYEGNVIIMITDKMKSNISKSDISYLILMKNSMEDILCSMINSRKCSTILSVRTTPRTIVMKVFGDIKKIVDLVKKDTNGEIGKIESIFDVKSYGTIIYFTENTISKSVGISDLYKDCIYTEKDYFEVFKYLRNQNLKYLNEGLHYEDWYELKIKIYDTYGRFDLHYKRMTYIMEKLELGIILGETWGTDAAIFFSVGIYKVRFFTFLDPLKIKQVLLGLEYLEDGTRLVDYDIYNKKKKIHWGDVKPENMTTNPKIEISNFYRLEILSHLTDDEKNKLYEMENAILKSRTFDSNKSSGHQIHN